MEIRMMEDFQNKMKGEVITALVSVIMGANGILIIFAKRFWDKKMKELEYKHIEDFSTDYKQLCGLIG